jgi:hypothetical protein
LPLSYEQHLEGDVVFVAAGETIEDIGKVQLG